MLFTIVWRDFFMYISVTLCSHLPMFSFFFHFNVYVYILFSKRLILKFEEINVQTLYLHMCQFRWIRGPCGGIALNSIPVKQ